MNVIFEPEIIFPKDPYEAAIMYIAVMAYPEQGAGQIGQPGYEFANALVKYGVWSVSKSRGKRNIRERKNDPNFQVPRKRDFEGTLEHGLRRVRRRFAAYSLVGNQLLQGFFNVRALGATAISEGRISEAFHVNPQGGYQPVKAELWKRGTPEVGAILSSAEPRWSDRMGLNKTNNPADRRQKVKDLKRRAYKPSVPVLHMAHGLSEAVENLSTQIEGFEKREPFNAMLFNSEKWIWEAIDSAQRWREAIGIGHMLNFNSHDLIELSRPGDKNG